MFVSYFTVNPVFIKIWILKCHQVCARSEKTKRASKMITCDLDVLPKYHIISISIPLRCLYLYWQSQLFISNQKYLISYCTVELPDTTWYSHVFTNHIEVSKVSCLQWHVSSIELNMQLRDILNHLKPTAEAAASTRVFVHLILGQNTYMCFTTLGALPKHFFGFDVPSRSGQPQLSNLTHEPMSPINNNQTVPLINQPLPRGRLFRGETGKDRTFQGQSDLVGGVINPMMTLHTTFSAPNTPLSLHSTLCTSPHSILRSLHWYGHRRTYLRPLICLFYKSLLRDCIRVRWLVLFWIKVNVCREWVKAWQEPRVRSKSRFPTH